MNQKPERGARGLGVFSACAYLFLYAPIFVLVALSFNSSRLSSSWQSFTLDWYFKAAANPAILVSLRNSLVVAAATTMIATALGTMAALALHRHTFRRRVSIEAALMLPTVAPEIVLAASMLLLFAFAELRLGFTTIILAHVGFTLSYAYMVVRARIAGFDRSLEEAAMDLGAGRLRTFLLVTLPAILPAVLAAGLLVFALSIDDYVVTSFVAGAGATTLPIQIYSMVKSGVSPEINAVSTMLLIATALLLLASFLLELGRQAARMAAAPALIGFGLLLAPFVMTPSFNTSSDRVLNLYFWSNYIAPETLKKFEERFGVTVNIDLYDSNEALLAKLQAGNTNYDVIVPSDYSVQVLRAQNLLQPLDIGALPNLRHTDPRFLNQEFDPGNRYSTPYFWGTTGIAWRKSLVREPVASLNALWDPRYRGRILMLDDAREVFGAALLRRGHSLNTVDERLLRTARDDLIAQRRLVRAYNSSNYEDILLAGDVWVAQGWSGQFAKAMEQNPDIAYAIPQEGGTLFIDNLAIPVGAPHKALAHLFMNWVMEPEIAAEICRTMKYSTPNRTALVLLPDSIRKNQAMFPPEKVVGRLELIRDLGSTTTLYDRLWTEVKSR